MADSEPVPREKRSVPKVVLGLAAVGLSRILSAQH